MMNDACPFDREPPLASLQLSGEKQNGGRHFQIRVADQTLAYCYIRKNGCTAFKRMFLELSQAERRDDEADYAFLLRCHRVKFTGVAAADLRICVLRDPVERAVSLYRNKFIQRDGAEDLLASYRTQTGQDPDEASFTDFVERYICLGPSGLDKHVRTQRSHLLPSTYNVVLPLSGLHTGMVRVLGQQLADRFFREPVNASDIRSSCDEEAFRLSSAALRARVDRAGCLPATGSLCSGQTRSVLEQIYAEDVILLMQAFGTKSLSR